MSERTGTTITCDRHSCRDEISRPTAEEAREAAQRAGWTRTEDGRDFCPRCSEIRAQRQKVASLVPPGVRLMTAWDAAEAVGWERREYDEDAAHFLCCGEAVTVSSLLGIAYYARCGICGKAIANVTGPTFQGSTVSLPDPDKVDLDDPRVWVVVSEYESAVAAP